MLATIFKIKTFCNRNEIPKRSKFAISVAFSFYFILFYFILFYFILFFKFYFLNFILFILLLFNSMHYPVLIMTNALLNPNHLFNLSPYSPPPW